jgi:hypothetical protein
LQEKWRKEKEKTPAKGKASIVPAASLTYALHRYKIVAESWEDTRLQEKWRKEKKKTLAEGKASLAPPTSLTYALRGYKIVAESQQDAKLLQTARGCGETKVEGWRV